MENLDLAKEILTFLSKYFGTNFFLYQFKNSGLIEYLILYLDTNLAQLAFTLLLKMQDVTLNYNEDLDLNKYLS